MTYNVFYTVIAQVSVNTLICVKIKTWRSSVDVNERTKRRKEPGTLRIDPPVALMK